ncbi:hypothetical protein SS50377_24473 [Spironucleus salmonicida]|uniref:Uncharacterized protein n=1 Tax=Spironucleus salmonicida TaxID=348837 RepID=A0A9P8LUL3_9EUKA|nr:hypothetical protein SS50377_24473 [Spironucleus salmonicida]
MSLAKQLEQTQQTLEQALEQCAFNELKANMLENKLLNVRKEFDNAMVYYQEEIERTVKDNLDLIKQLNSFKESQISLLQIQQQNSDVSQFKQKFNSVEDIFEYYYNLEVAELNQLQRILEIRNKKSFK